MGPTAAVLLRTGKYTKSILSKDLFTLNSLCLSLSLRGSVCQTVHVWSIEEAFKSPEPGATGGYELPDVGSGNCA